MKTIAFFVAASLAVASANVHIHIRSHHHQKGLAEWQMGCNKESCNDGLTCVKKGEKGNWQYQCLSKTPAEWGECGGDVQCPNGTKCHKKDNWYSQCTPSKTTGGSDDGGNGDGLTEWAMCSDGAKCAKGLTCLKKGDPGNHIYQCIKVNAPEWGECGTGITCPNGQSCVLSNAWYSQCLPTKKHHKKHHHKKHHSEDGLPEWAMCPNGATCAKGLTCLKKGDPGNYIYQCIKTKAPLWGECGTGITCSKKQTCVASNSWYSQCVPKKHHKKHKKQVEEDESVDASFDDEESSDA